MMLSKQAGAFLDHGNLGLRTCATDRLLKGPLRLRDRRRRFFGAAQLRCRTGKTPGRQAIGVSERGSRGKPARTDKLVVRSTRRNLETRNFNIGSLLTQPPANEQFATVVMPHLDDAYALARWLTGNSADAEDIVQEACLRALRGLDRYSGGNARAWLLAITRNTAFTWMARNRPKALLVTEDIEALAPADDAATPEEALIEKADAAAIERAIGALPPPFKETLVLRDINGLSYREIAEITDVPVGTVMSRLARARGLLMAALGSPQIK